MSAETRDALLGGAVPLLQRAGGHRAGTDAVLLAQLAPVRDGDVVMDLGAATGAVGLSVARRAALRRLVLVERDPDLAALARRNLALNGLEERGSVLEADVFTSVWGGEGADLVMTNPPFFEAGSRASPDPARASAHTFKDGGLAEWLATAARWLRHRGRLALIHRADRLDVILRLLRPAFGSVEIRPIHPRADAVATRIVVTAVRNGRAPLILHPPLALHGPDGRFTPEAQRLHEAPALIGDG